LKHRQDKVDGKASSHLQAIHEYIATNSKTYATRFIKALVAATRKLETMPFCGRVVPELENLGLREVIYRSYRVVYRVSGTSREVEILAVIHSARDFEKALHSEYEL